MDARPEVPVGASRLAARTGRRSIFATWKEMRPYLGASTTDVVALVVLSAVAGFAEAGVLLLIVQASLAVTGGDDAVEVSVGPLSLSGIDVATMLGGAGALLLVVFVLRYWSSRLIATVSARSLREGRARIFRSFVNASWDVQATEKTGHLQEVLSTNIDRAAFASLSVTAALAAAFQFGALLISGIVVQPVAAMGILVGVVGLFFVFRPISKVSRRLALANLEAKGDYASGVAETVSMAQEMHTFDVGEVVTAEVERDAALVAELHRRSKLLAKLLPSLYQNSVLLVVLGGVLAVHLLDIEDVAALGAVVLMLVRALTYSQTVQTTHQAMADLMPYLEEARDEQVRYEEAAVPRDGDPLDRIDRVTFDNVTFTYAGATRPALLGVDLEVRRGEAIGIVGPSGSGKSTFMQLFLRLRQAQEGSVLVNGRPAEDLAIGEWYSRVGVVTQDARLFSGSVRDNVRFHRPDLTEADLQRAVEQAHVAADIDLFEAGWNTHVGERGGGAVSGGQRQRLCLARALAGTPDVLVLDEPTSALDMRSEALIRETLEDLKGEVTLVIIAHRMSTLSVCDRLAVFDGGRLSAVGPAEEMLRTNPFLAEASELSRR